MRSLVNYEIKELIPGVFAIIVNDSYQRAMLFLRSQEHYESKFSEIKGKHFDIFEFMEIYRGVRDNDIFTYPLDWSGFNVPGHIVETCTKHVLDARNGILPTQYDYTMNSIIDEIKGRLSKNKRWYLIGTDRTEGEIVDHELCHGLFYVNSEYKKTTESMVRDLPEKIQTEMERILMDMGYCEEVIIDEIQAYMSVRLTKEMSKIRGIKKHCKGFQDNLKIFKQKTIKKA